MDTLDEVLERAVSARFAPHAVAAVSGLDGLSVCAAEGTDPDLLFEIGSVTKVMTATLVLQHVERGDLGLDDPVAEHVPDFVLDLPEATPLVTVRHLLTHTSGVDFDELTDVGDDDECLGRYVRDALRGEAWDHPGERWSYSNGGYSLLGRLVEVLDGRPWDDALIERIGAPLALGVTTNARVTPGRPVAQGHAFDTTTREIVEEHRHFPRSTGPAGGAVATAADLATFGQALLAGRGELLSASVAREMMTAQPGLARRGQGLGWLVNTAGLPFYGGGTPGFTAFLLAIPSLGVCISVVTDGPGAQGIAQRVAAHFLGPQDPTDPPAGNDPEIRPEACVGVYARRHVSHHVTWDGTTLTSRQEHHGPMAELFADPPPFLFRPLGGGRFILQSAVPGMGIHLWADFSDPDEQGRPTRLLTLRSHVRVSDQGTNED